MGRPKALVELDGEPLVCRARRALITAGLAPCVVVLGAGAREARAVLGPDAETVLAPDWDEGMGRSLRAGLAVLADRPEVTAALVSLVDTPGIGAAALRRVAGAVPGAGALARGAFAGRPGHPVLLGRDHWAGVAAAARGDSGARHYLHGHPDLVPVEVSDVADPGDLDTPEALEALAARTSHHP